MKSLKIKETVQSPRVNFNSDTPLLISGRSLPEDSKTFYAPVIKWISDFIAEDGAVSLSLDLKYFNSSTAIQLLRILTILEEHQLDSKNVSVEWVYQKNDDISLQKGEELAAMVDLPFSFTEIAN